MRGGEEGNSWRCVAVTRDPRNTARVRITCRDESELARVKEAAEKTKAAGSRVLRDQWYPVKVDNACRTAVLDEVGELRTGIVEMLEKCNWNQTDAAERFRVPLSTLNQKIKRLSIEIKKRMRE